ncbi:hypothetical protein J2Z60_001072 [Lactobacillus colini]|uniref:Phage protein n=1 Tax=Lactobacillus colini TaxID=1819254 RepID=A0ABS4MDX9_9LACO|nr:hypothetical protein [Lactobacillus colini]MBP2057897.1 hypothetical protein [Lactobacillus colini]
MAVAKKNATQKLADQLAEQKKKAEAAAIPSKLGNTRIIKIHKGKEDEYELMLRYPGTQIAMEILDDCMKPGEQGYFRSVFMNDVISNNVIVQPVIKSVAFFDEHPGLIEACDEIMDFIAQFLND